MTRHHSSTGAAPLRAWGETLARARRARLRRARERVLIGLAGALACSLLRAEPAPRLVWNISASAPRGLYLLESAARLRHGDMVAARLPAQWRMLADQRRYLPARIPLIKRIAALSGDSVCAFGAVVTVNGQARALRRDADSLGRRLPAWQGCVHLRDGQVLLLMEGNPASFDGRYFGVTEAADVLGRARLIWHR
ncbi:S26 family signal peptidase [Sphingosinicella microcystinivorans]|uniref:S26 family signal peptidase n=1 Tax=Sphingosinicella microcystinivorans TaxID=335406 RepID=UPI0022F3FED6|nr:S26 family signal peptidase [Sphingosinicella microcystinivorans]WBX83813.1 S26 family signal peptidase [Sphingosinicella microcystinivorans]